MDLANRHGAASMKASTFNGSGIAPANLPDHIERVVGHHMTATCCMRATLTTRPDPARCHLLSRPENGPADLRPRAGCGVETPVAGAPSHPRRPSRSSATEGGVSTHESMFRMRP